MRQRRVGGRVGLRGIGRAEVAGQGRAGQGRQGRAGQARAGQKWLFAEKPRRIA